MIYIVIPVFNRKVFTRACLISLQKQTMQEFRVIVIDHGSKDGTDAMIQTEFPELLLLKGDESMWWAAATNLGIKKILEISISDTDLVLTLNNDLEVNPDYLLELLKVYEKKQPCLVGSTSVDINNNDKISFIGGTWNKFTAKYKSHKATSLPYGIVAGMFDSLPSDLLPGRGTLLPIKAFKQIGLYDELNFPHYAADEDFSLMAKNKGYKLLVSTKAVVKSHINETGTNVKKTITFYSFIQSLNSIRSANNLKHRYQWAKKHAKFPNIYFVIDIGRVFGSYFRVLIK